MGEEIKDNCGIALAHTLHDTYSFIKSLQHRGREAAGLVAVGYNKIDAIKWIGTVDRFDIQSLDNIFPSHSHAYHTYMAHVRYATRGRKDKLLEDAHPHIIGGSSENKGSHIIIKDCDMAIIHNGQVNSEQFTGLELKTECDTEGLLHLIKQKGNRFILENINGSFTLALADKTKDYIVIMRDKLGMRPGVLGYKDGRYCVASENVAILKNGGKFIKDLEPGQIHYLSSKGGYWSEEVIHVNPRHCFFEWNYLAHVESEINELSVRKIRKFLGEELAKEFNIRDADYVTFLPRCPEEAAMAYSQETGIPLKHVFYKMHDERSFQGSTQGDRKNSIQTNLYILPEIEGKPMQEFLRRKTLILIDDSTIRGTNSRRAKELLYDTYKVKKAYLLNYTPQIGIIGEDDVQRGCLFGVDMPPNDDFIVTEKDEEGRSYRNKTIKEISNEIGMPIGYISEEGMLRAFERAGLPRNNLCYYCIGGRHPFEI